MFISRKKMIAVAAAVACGAPLAALAQSNVTVYGKLYPQINKIDVKGATARGTAVSTLTAAIPATRPEDSDLIAMESSNARIGFRGSEDLGGGLKGIFQLEGAFGVDDGTFGTAGKLFSRNTFVGLSGGFGVVKLGRMDTVYKELGDTLSFLGVSSGNFVSNSEVLSKPGFGGSNASFHLRADNTIMYESPEVAGFQGLFGYSLGEVAGNNSRASIISTGVKFENGPIYVALGHERHDDFFGGSRNSPSALRNITGTDTRAPLPGASAEDTATRLTLQYKFTKDTRVEANVARLEFDEEGGAAGRFQNYRTVTWGIGAEQRMGPTTFAVSYVQADDGSCSLVGGAACSTRGLGSKQLSLGSSYALSKRTALFLIGSYLKNDESARRNNSALDVAPGQDTRQIALGVSHNF